MEAGVTLNLNSSPFAKGVEDAKKKAREFVGELRHVSDIVRLAFEKEPSGKVAKAFPEITKNILRTGSAASTAEDAISGMIGALGIPLPVQAAFGVIAAAIPFIATAGQNAKRSVHEIGREGLRMTKEVNWESPAEAVDLLKDRSKHLHENLRKNTEEARRFSVSLHPISGILRRLYGAGEQAISATGFGKIQQHGMGESLFAGLKGELFPPDLNRLTSQQLEKQKEIAKAKADMVKSSKDDLAITRERVYGDRFEAAILKDQRDTEAQISHLKGTGADDLRAAAKARQDEIRAQQALVKLDIAAEFHKLQVTRPGIGLTESQVSGSQLFRRRADAQEELRLAMNPEARAKAKLSLDSVRNEIEQAEYSQYRKDIGITGSQTSSRAFGGGSRTWGEQRTAARHKRIMEAIQSNPALKSQLDTELGVNFAGKAPGQTGAMPNTSRGSSEITGGRTLADLYNIIEQKWQ